MTLRDDILDRIDIVDLVSRYVDLKKVGRNHTGLCPFHREKSPSFTVAEDKQIFKCFGCGKGGNAITFHMEMERIDFWDSIQLLARETGVDIQQYSRDPEKSKEEKSLKEKLKLLNKRTQAFFEKNLIDSPALEYATTHRKLSPETIATFGIGYAPDSYHALTTLLSEKGFVAQDMVEGGVAKQKDGNKPYDFFRHRMTFPIHDHIGNIVGFGARALDSDQKPKYLNTTETQLYEKSKVLYGLDKARHHIKTYGGLVIVEGYMDVVALAQAGLPIGVATCGTAMTPLHTKLLTRYTEHIYFAFDHDNAGFEATMRALGVAYMQDLFPKVLQFPDIYKDVDERVQSPDFAGIGGEEIDIPQAIKDMSVDAFAWILGKLDERDDMSNPVLRKKTTKIIFELLSKIEDYTILQLYFSQFADFLSLNHELLWKQFKQHVGKQRTRPSYEPKDSEKEQQPTNSVSLPEKYIVAALVQDGYMKTLGGDQEKLDIYIQRLKILGEHFPQSTIGEVMSGNISASSAEHIKEAELRREQQVADVDSAKLTDFLLKFLDTQIRKLQKIVLKSTNLSDEKKQGLIKQMRG